MDNSELLEQYQLNKSKLIDYGFKLDNDYSLTNQLDGNLYVKFIINDNQFMIYVYDVTNNEEYLPFTIKHSNGTYVSEIRKKVADMKYDILSHCFNKNNKKDEVIKYIIEKYHTKLEYPWESNPDYCTLKTNNKWYGIIMNVPYKTIGIDSTGKVDIINLKNNPEKIQQLIDNKNFFPAYHMNKKYWITVVVDNKINNHVLQKLIDESYDLVKSK